MADEIVKRGPGQPRKYMPDALENKFNEYLNYCKKEEQFPNIAGFCVFAEINSDTYYNYKENYPEYSETIKRIDGKLLDITIQKGTEARNPAFTIFYMKNKFNWSDKQEIVQTTENTVKLEGISAEDLQNIADKLKDK